MLFYIIIAVAALVFIGTFAWWVREEGFAYAGTYGYSILFGGLVAGVGMLVILFLGAAPIWNQVQVGSTYSSDALVSMKTGSSTSVKGEFFLGSGTVAGSSDVNYTYVYKQKDDKGAIYYQTGVVKVSESRVYESDSAQPKIQNYSTTYELRNAAIVPWSIEADTTYAYHFTVPKDSIIQNYQPN